MLPRRVLLRAGRQLGASNVQGLATCQTAVVALPIDIVEQSHDCFLIIVNRELLTFRRESRGFSVLRNMAPDLFSVGHGLSKWSDVVLVSSDGKELHVHRLILGMHSQVRAGRHKQSGLEPIAFCYVTTSTLPLLQPQPFLSINFIPDRLSRCGRKHTCIASLHWRHGMPNAACTNP